MKEMKNFVQQELEKDKQIKQVPYKGNEKLWEENIKKRFISRIMYNIENGENPDLDDFVSYLENTSDYIKNLLGFNKEDIVMINSSFDKKNKINKIANS